MGSDYIELELSAGDVLTIGDYQIAILDVGNDSIDVRIDDGEEFPAADVCIE